MIKLDDVIESMEFDFPEPYYNYDKKNDADVMVNDSDFTYAEDSRRIGKFYLSGT